MTEYKKPNNIIQRFFQSFQGKPKPIYKCSECGKILALHEFETCLSMWIVNICGSCVNQDKRIIWLPNRPKRNE